MAWEGVVRNENYGNPLPEELGIPVLTEVERPVGHGLLGQVLQASPELLCD